MARTSLGHTRTLDGVTFEETLEKIPEKLKAIGFGVVSQVDVTDIMKQKLGIDFQKYRILGVCNPNLAHQALTNDPFIGLLLPCTMVVFNDPEGKTVVSIADANARFAALDNPMAQAMARDVDEKMKQVLQTL
jgi:uncharacterized protein (DUF302 family)